MDDFDLKCIELAIAEAEKTVVSDPESEPKVGAVAAKDGKVLASAHRGERYPADAPPTPTDHAEFTLLEKKLKDQPLAGCTVYTTLEPCTERGEGKRACANRLLERKVARVVVGMVDPHWSIHHRGIDRLQERRVQVDWFPVLARERLEELNRDFVRAHRRVREELFAEIRRSGRGKIGLERPKETEGEGTFIQQLHGTSLTLGRLSIEAKLLPRELWLADRRANRFYDDVDADAQVQLTMFDRPLPGGLLQQLLSELKEIAEKSPGAREVLEVLNMGSNAYPRLVGVPDLQALSAQDSTAKLLNIPLAPNQYGVALVAERFPDLPSCKKLRESYALNSLAVRVALIFKHDGQWWMELQQRDSKSNATFKNSWDVSAAGYVDASLHADPEDESRISPWWACANELQQELKIPMAQLPHRDHYHFFGVGRNDRTGQLDLLAYCDSPEAPDPGRPTSRKVSRYDRISLSPSNVVRALAERRRWIPTAILTIALTLEALGYSKQEVEREFSALAGQLDLTP